MVLNWTGMYARYKTKMADSGQSDVTVDKLIQRLDQAVEDNDEKSEEIVADVLRLENQLNIEDREAFHGAKFDQCMKAIRLQSLSLLKLLFSKDFVLVEDKLDFKTNKEFICCAIQADFLEGVKFLVDNGLKFESEPGDQEWVALFQAVKDGKPQIIDFLLKEQPNHVHSTLQGMTLVGLACKERNFDVLKLLLNSATTFDLNKVCGEQLALTPLQWCFENDLTPDLLDCVKLLVENGANFNITDSRNNQTSLVMAACLNVPDLVKYFIENGADLTSCDSKKNTALHYLCQNPETKDSLDCIKRFVERIQSTKNLHILETKNSSGETSFFVAVTSDNLLIVDILVEAGCDVNVKCLENGETILSAAIMMKATHSPTSDIVAKLITAGSNVNASDVYGYTPLMQAAFCKDLDSIRLLIQHGADLKHKDMDGNTLINHCLQNENKGKSAKDILEFFHQKCVRIEMEKLTDEYLLNILNNDDSDTFEYLVSNGLDIHHIGKNNRNILHLLPQSGTKIFYKIKHHCDEADVNQQDTDGDTPLMVSAEHFGTFVSYFLEKGADVNLRNKKGQTPLMIFATDNYKEILQELIDAGADVNIRAQDGRTALQFLEPKSGYANPNQRYLDCLKLFLENGGARSLDYKDLYGFTPFQYLLGTKRFSFMWYLITQNCSMSSFPNSGDEEIFKFLYKYQNKLLKLAKIFYHCGAPRQLILDTFEMDEPEENFFKRFCDNLSLTELCRRQIRMCIGPGIQEKLQTLNIAPKLIQFICLRDLIPLKRFDINNIAQYDFEEETDDDDDDDDDDADE